MSRANCPDPRSSRRSRRRQTVLVCCGLSYLALVAAGLLALVSLAVSVGPATIAALVLAGALAVAAIALLAVDNVLAPAAAEAREERQPFAARAA